MTHQILSVLPPLDWLDSKFSPDQFDQLDGSSGSWSKAISLLEDTLALAPPLLFCVIDNLNVVPTNGSHVKEFIAPLRHAMKAEGKTLKILFTTSLRAFTLLPALSGDEIRIIEGIRRPGLPGGAVPGRIPMLA